VIFKEIGCVQFERALPQSNLASLKKALVVTKRAITFERVVGLGRAAACGVQNSNGKLIVVPFARKMKSLGPETKLKVTHTSSTF